MTDGMFQFGKRQDTSQLLPYIYSLSHEYSQLHSRELCHHLTGRTCQQQQSQMILAQKESLWCGIGHPNPEAGMAGSLMYTDAV